MDGKRGKLGFGVGRRVSLMLATVTGAARELSGHDLRRLLGLRVYELSFRRERRRCAIECALLGGLLVSTFLAPLLDADLRAQPHFHLHEADASLKARVLARHLCPWSFGPFFTTFRKRKVVR